MPLELVEATLTTGGGSLTAPLAANLKQTYIMIWSQLLSNSHAQGILSFLQSSGSIVGVLIVDSGSDSLHMAPSAMAGGTAAKYTGGIAVVNINTPMTIKSTAIPLGVSFLHEIGHAKQCIEQTGWYEDLYAKILRNAGLARNATSLKDEAIKNSSAVQNYKGPFAGKRKLQGEVIAEWEKSYGNGPRRTLENDNLARHEKPVLVEMGLPYRDDYFNG